MHLTYYIAHGYGGVAFLQSRNPYMVTTMDLAYDLNMLCKVGVAALVYTSIFGSVSSLAMFYSFEIILFVC